MGVARQLRTLRPGGTTSTGVFVTVKECVVPRRAVPKASMKSELTVAWKIRTTILAKTRISTTTTLQPGRLRTQSISKLPHCLPTTSTMLV